VATTLFEFLHTRSCKHQAAFHQRFHHKLIREKGVVEALEREHALPGSKNKQQVFI
jgi:hypothetical protein